MASNSDIAIGLTGKNAAGKGEAAELLKNLGYTYYSLSDILREEADRRGLTHSRENLIQLGRDLRVSDGAGVLGVRTVEKLGRGRYVIDSIRHPLEIEALRARGDFFLLGIDAPIEVRFERASRRGRNENATTLAEFQKMEDRERTTEENAQQLDRCLEQADIILQNDSDLPTLHQRVRKILDSITKTEA